MMRAQNGFAIAVRRPSGEIIVKERPWRSIAQKFPFLRLPLLRGMVVLFESLWVGMDALNFSAEQALPVEKSATDKSSENSALSSTVSLLVAMVFGIGLFVVLPHALAFMAGRFLGGLSLQSVAFQVTAGGFKLVIFISYLLLLSQLKDVRRLFMYHGAEHKVIAAYETGKTLTVDEARVQTTYHARCGTSLLLVVVVLAIVLFAIVFPLIPGLGEGVRSHILTIAIKIPLMLPVAGFAYEFNRWAATRLASPVVRFLVWPGLMLQRLTTREPSDDMLEVALSSLKAALRQHEKALATNSEVVEVYRDFSDVCVRVV